MKNYATNLISQDRSKAEFLHPLSVDNNCLPSNHIITEMREATRLSKAALAMSAKVRTTERQRGVQKKERKEGGSGGARYERTNQSSSRARSGCVVRSSIVYGQGCVNSFGHFRKRQEVTLGKFGILHETQPGQSLPKCVANWRCDGWAEAFARAFTRPDNGKERVWGRGRFWQKTTRLRHGRSLTAQCAI